MLKIWNVILVSLAFCLSLFGTFLTRSGIVSSIHSFTQSSIGGWFLGFIVVVVVLTIGLIFYRLPLLKTKTRLESLVSREATFLYNNLLLVALCLTILWGVTWPIITEAVSGEARVVGRPYYDFFLRSFGLPLLLLMGIGPLIAWRKASLRGLGKTFAWPAGIAVLTGVVLIVLGAGSSTPGLIAYTFSAFVLGTIGLEFVRGTRARHSLSSEDWPRAFSSLIARNRRRYGGYIVHAAIVLLAIGIAGSSAYQHVTDKKLARGDSLNVGPYTLTYRALERSSNANATEVRAVLDIRRGTQLVGTVRSGKNSYTEPAGTVSNEVGIHTNYLTGEDIFVIAETVYGNGTVSFRVLVKPLVNLIWLAGLIFLLGSLITLWPDAREQRRLATRYAELGSGASPAR